MSSFSMTLRKKAYHETVGVKMLLKLPSPFYLKKVSYTNIATKCQAIQLIILN